MLVSKGTTSAIEKVTAILAQLAIEAKVIDKQNKQLKSHSLLQDKAIFSEHLFSTYSDSIYDYVNEVQKKTVELKRLIDGNKVELSHNRLLLIEQQISALINALNANKSIHNEAQNRLNAIKSRKIKMVADKIIKPTQSLYQNLAEHHEFERRLAEMLRDKEIEFKISPTNKTQMLSQEILVLHQRLGRCRQAISKIELQIEFAEKRQQT